MNVDDIMFICLKVFNLLKLDYSTQKNEQLFPEKTL